MELTFNYVQSLLFIVAVALVSFARSVDDRNECGKCSICRVNRHKHINIQKAPQ